MCALEETPEPRACPQPSRGALEASRNEITCMEVSYQHRQEQPLSLLSSHQPLLVSPLKWQVSLLIPNPEQLKGE